jgi:hypothetical protein
VAQWVRPSSVTQKSGVQSLHEGCFFLDTFLHHNKRILVRRRKQNRKLWWKIESKEGRERERAGVGVELYVFVKKNACSEIAKMFQHHLFYAGTMNCRKCFDTFF